MKFYVINSLDNLPFQSYYSNLHTISFQKMHIILVVQFFAKKTSPTGLCVDMAPIFLQMRKCGINHQFIFTKANLYFWFSMKEKKFSVLLLCRHQIKILLLFFSSRKQRITEQNNYKFYLSWSSETNFEFLKNWDLFCS